MIAANTTHEPTGQAGKEAVTWLLRIRDEGLSPLDRERWNAWHACDENREAFAAVLSLLPALDAPRPAMPTAEELAADRYEEPVADGRNVLPLPQMFFVPMRPRARAAGHRKIAAALSGIVLAALLALIAKGAWFDRVVETQASEWRNVRLTDDTVIRLGPRTRLRLEFADNQRSIDLIDGEAYFEVAKDPARPFVVRTDVASVRAVGTAFGVTSHGQRVVVTVSDGTVAISPDDVTLRGTVAAVDPVLASAGEQVAVSDRWPVVPTKVDVAVELAWSERMLAFTHETVGEAIDEFNRRNRIQLVLADPAIASVPVRGIFHANDPVAFAKALAGASSGTLTWEDADTLRVSVTDGRSTR